MSAAHSKTWCWKSFSAGAAAGALDTCITMPLDTIKTKMQIAHYDGMVGCTRSIIRHDGVLGLYFGFTPFLVQASGKAAVRFCMFDLLTKPPAPERGWRSAHAFFYGPLNTTVAAAAAPAMPPAVDAAGFDRARNHATWAGICGLGAGMAEALFWTAPTERIKVLRQARAGEGHIVGLPIAHIVREQGVTGLYVGASATALRQASSVALRFTIVDEVKTLACAGMGYEKKSAPTWVAFLGGGIGGFVSAIINNPIDVVKSRIQAGGGGISVLQCLRQTVSEGGFRALTAGISARSSRLFVSQAIQFGVVDKLTKLIS